MAYVLFDACSYCYGPAGSLSTVMDCIDSSIDVYLVGLGSSLEILQSHKSVKKVFKLDTEDLYQLEKIKDIIQKASLIVTNMNPVLAVYSKIVGAKVIFIDILPWMDASIESRLKSVKMLNRNNEFLESLPNLEIYYQNIDKFIMQNYLEEFPIDTNIKNYEVVSPLLDSFVYEGLKNVIDNRLLICTGGLFNPDVEPTSLFSYCDVLIDAACRVSEQNGISEILLCGPPALSKFTQFYKDKLNVKAVCLAHYDFVRLLSTSKYVAIVPGLTSIYETFALGCNTLLLPPTNYSQVFQIQAVRNQNLGGNLICKNLFPQMIHTCKEYGEIQATKQLMKLIDEVIKSGELYHVIEEGFSELFLCPNSPIVQKRKQFIHGMGKNAVERILYNIRQFV